MIQFFKKNIESNKKLRTFEIIVLCLLVFTSIGSVFYGLMQIHKAGSGRVCATGW